MSLQAQATPKVLGLNVPLTAGRNKTLFMCVCVVTPQVSSAELISMSTLRVCLFVVFVLRREIPLNMLQHIQHVLLIFTFFV